MSSWCYGADKGHASNGGAEGTPDDKARSRPLHGALDHNSAPLF
jgi:hypothetical protein